MDKKKPLPMTSKDAYVIAKSLKKLNIFQKYNILKTINKIKNKPDDSN